MGNSDDKKNDTSFACPYCTKEIPLDVSSCPSCGVSYGSETIQLVRSFTTEAVRKDRKERRKYDRVPKRFRVSYQSLESFSNSYLSNIGKGGVYIRTDQPLDTGTQFQLRISLPDGKEELEVMCEVVWGCTPEAASSQGNTSAGMGVRFLNLTEAGKDRIDEILKAFG